MVSPLTIQFVGTIPVSEILLFLMLPIILIQRKIKRFDRTTKTLLILMMIWAIDQATTDLYRHTSAQDMAKGIAAILFFALDLIGLVALIGGSSKRIALFAIGSVAAVALRVWIAPDHSIIPNATLAINWKFGYGHAVHIIVLLFASFLYKKRLFLTILICSVAAGIIDISFDARSLGLMILVSSPLVLPVLRMRPPSFRRLSGRAERALAERAAPKRIAIILVVCLLASILTGQLYSYAAARGFLGPEAAQKYDVQSRGRYGILVGGRPETLVETRAVLASPIVGYGSYAKDIDYVYMLHDLLLESGYAETTQEAGGDLEVVGSEIPVHSYLMQGWIWAGIIGAIFWFYVLALAVRSLYRLTLIQSQWAPLYSYLLVGFCWDLLFSPFGLDARLTCSYLLVIMLGIDVFSKPSIEIPLQSAYRTRDRFDRQGEIRSTHYLGFGASNAGAWETT